MQHLSRDSFIRFSNAAFQKVGASIEAASTTTNILLEASLSGYDSHGIMRIPRYIPECINGTIQAGSQPSIEHATSSIASINGNLSLGPCSASLAVQKAVALARESGIGCVTAYNTNDIGRLASYFEDYYSDELIIIVCANDAGTGGSVAPWGGSAPLLSTNPVAALLPSAERHPFVIDMSTAMTSVGFVRNALLNERQIPEGFLIQPDGSLTTDPQSFFTAPKSSALLPLGSLVNGYKGYCLSLLVEGLAGALSGAGCSTGENRSYSRNGLFVLALDPEKFGGRNVFLDEIGALVQRIKSSRRLPNIEEILIPGERASRERIQRAQSGIPISDTTFAQLLQICKDLEIDSNLLSSF